MKVTPPDDDPKDRVTIEDARVRREDVVDVLNALVGFASLIARDDVSPEYRRRYAEHIRTSAEAMRSIVARFAASSSSGLTSEMRLVAVAPPGHDAEPTRPPSLPPSISPPTATRARILIVDRSQVNRELFAAYLDSSRYTIDLAASADEALRITQETPPDIALIDISGTWSEAFDTARQIKAAVGDELMPVVFITAFGDGDARTRALEAGAVQFLDKPISRHDLRARVRNLLHLRSEQRTLAIQNAQLRSLQTFKNEMTNLVIHDLKGPLSAMTMNLEVALAETEGRPELHLIRESLEDSRVSGVRMFRMIANLLDIGRNEDGRLVPNLERLDVATLVETLVKEHAAEASSRNIDLRFRSGVTRPIDGDADLLERVLDNLIENALRFTRAKGHILVEVRDGDDLEILVANDGPAIPPEQRALIFEKYEQAPNSERGGAHRGLGLYFCDVAVRAHGGRIYLSEEPGFPTCFRIVLPRWEIDRHRTMAPSSAARGTAK